MMDPDRIERAARAMWGEYCDSLGWPNGQPTWDELVAWGPITKDTHPGVRPWKAHRDRIRDHAAAALAAAYPELHGDKPTHWLAPMEATEGMLDASTTLMYAHSFAGETQADIERTCTREEWAAFRDTYLQSDKDKTT